MLTARTKSFLPKQSSLLHAPQWSPDGKTIAAIDILSADSTIGSIDLFDAATGQKTVFLKSECLPRFPRLAARWPRAVSFCPPTPARITIAGRSESFPIPKANIRAVTKDTNDYLSVSLSADGKSIATIQSQPRGSVHDGFLRRKNIRPALHHQRPPSHHSRLPGVRTTNFFSNRKTEFSA